MWKQNTVFYNFDIVVKLMYFHCPRNVIAISTCDASLSFLKVILVESVAVGGLHQSSELLVEFKKGRNSKENNNV